MKQALCAAAILAACSTSGSGVQTAAKVAALTGSAAVNGSCYDPADYGAQVTSPGSAPIDARAGIQAAIAAAGAGGEVCLGPGVWWVSKSPSGYYDLVLGGPIKLRGAGRSVTSIKQMAATPTSVRVLQVTGPDVWISDLALDGDKAEQTADEHRAGVFATATTDLKIERVDAHDFSGDGYYMYTDTRDTQLVDVAARDNDRNGITLGSSLQRLSVERSKFYGNKAQQFDSEPGSGTVVSGVRITDSYFDGAGASGDYVITISGNATAAKGHDWTVSGNEIDGGIFAVWVERVTIANNVGVNPTAKSCLYVYRSSSDVIYTGNHCRMTQSAVPSIAGVTISGTGAGSAPARVLVANNGVRMDSPTTWAVSATGAEDVTIANNALRGSGTSAGALNYYGGVFLRATVPGAYFRSASVTGNRIVDFGSRGVSVGGNTGAQMLQLDVGGNVFDDDSATATQMVGMSLDDGYHSVQTITLVGNRCSGGVATCVANVPPAASIYQAP